MSRRTDGRGVSLEAALRDALSDLLGTEPDAIVLKVDAPGIEDLQGALRFDLEVAAPVDVEVASPAEAGEPPPGEPSPGASASDDEPVGADPVDGTREVTVGGRTTSSGEVEEEGDGVLTVEELDAEADAAADFLEGLLDAMDLPGDIRIRTAEDHAEVEVVDIGSGALIGRRGQTLEAIQELVRCALQREFQRRSRVKVDAEGYRSRRLEKLLEKAEEAIDEVLDTGEPVRLEPMDVFERKAVHQLVAEVEGLASRSQGREPARRIVIEAD